MFTGLVQDLGRVTAVDATADGVRLSLGTPLAEQVRHGDSIAVSGVCLTAVADGGDAAQITADVMHETLRRSSLGALTTGATVNLELALRADARLGGHVVQGHVDGLGTIAGVARDGFAQTVTVAVPGGVTGLLRYVVHKGSIAVDGISLTVARVDDISFDVSLIPETRQRTTLGRATPGTAVNLEVDVMAKYAEKLLGPYVDALADAGSTGA